MAMGFAVGLGAGAVGEHTGGTHVSVKEVGDSIASSIRFYSVFFLQFSVHFFSSSVQLLIQCWFLQRRMVEIVRQRQDVAAQEVGKVCSILAACGCVYTLCGFRSISSWWSSVVAEWSSDTLSVQFIPMQSAVRVSICCAQ